MPAPAATPQPQTTPDVAPQPAPSPHRASRRPSKSHQPLKMSPFATLLGLVLLMQVVAVLWLQGMAMAARNKAARLDRELKSTQLQLSRTQDRIARAVANAPQIEEWAARGNWKLAEQKDFDDLRDKRRYVSAEELNHRGTEAQRRRRRGGQR